MGGDRKRADGRVLRGHRNRDAVVEAFLALIEEGDHRPTARAIAERAGVSVRSVFGHFEDLEQIYEVAGHRQMAKLHSLLAPVDPATPLGARIDEFVDRRRRLLEELDPVARAARLREPFSVQLQANRRRAVQLMQEQCRATFAPELEALAPEDRDRVLNALATASSWSAWYHLRNDQQQGEAGAAEAVRTLLSGVLQSSVPGVPATSRSH